MAECGAVSEIRDSNRVSGKKKNNKDSIEIKKTIKDSNVLETFNEEAPQIKSHYSTEDVTSDNEDQSTVKTKPVRFMKLYICDFRLLKTATFIDLSNGVLVL